VTVVSGGIVNIGLAIEMFGWTVPLVFVIGMLGGFVYVVVLLHRLVRVNEEILKVLQDR